jgi:hypothetical protein
MAKPMVMSDMAAPASGHKQTDHFENHRAGEAAVYFSFDALTPARPCRQGFGGGRRHGKASEIMIRESVERQTACSRSEVRKVRRRDRFQRTAGRSKRSGSTDARPAKLKPPPACRAVLLYRGYTAARGGDIEAGGQGHSAVVLKRNQAILVLVGEQAIDRWPSPSQTNFA